VVARVAGSGSSAVKSVGEVVRRQRHLLYPCTVWSCLARSSPNSKSRQEHPPQQAECPGVLAPEVLSFSKSPVISVERCPNSPCHTAQAQCLESCGEQAQETDCPPKQKRRKDQPAEKHRLRWIHQPPVDKSRQPEHLKGCQGYTDQTDD